MDRVEAFLTALVPYLPYLWYALPFVVLGISLALHNHVNGYAKQTIAAVYRASLKTAERYREAGLEWLLSDEGVVYRKMLASRAYVLMPERIGPVPVGLALRLLVSEEQFCQVVEAAFQEMAELAAQLDLPDELPEE